MNNAIEINRLIKSYGNHTVLKGFDLCVKKGEVFALLGVNGAGKTTALECIEHLRKYDSGNITVNGKTGIQLQSGSLPDHIRPMEAIHFFAKWNKTKIDDSMLETLGIKELKKRQYHQLSTGQKRRLHLALALISDPDIIFLDEPTAGLDVEGRISLHHQIKKLKEQGKTVVLTSHDMSEVEALCDRIAILTHGDIVFSGTIEELSAMANTRFHIHLKTEQGEECIEADDIGETMLTVLNDYKKRNITVLDIKVDRGTLEQHFMDMTKEDSI